jgi:8-amino-7-oxononanoate synthase
MQFRERLKQRLNIRRSDEAYRTLQTPSSALVDFVSNDYLGLARDPALQERVRERAGDFPFSGSTGSRLLSGQSELADAVERRIAAFHGAEAALIFNSGYDANLGLLSALLQEGDVALYDERVHASMHDGLRLGSAQSFAFRHGDLEHLERRLERLKESRTAGSTAWILVESIYSMDGDLAPLTELCSLAERFDGQLIVDEAHATGMFGENGAGRVCELGLSDRVFARVHTFGKALGAHGGAVIGSQVLRETLINFSRPFIYSTALPAHSLLAIDAAYEYLPSALEERRSLQELIVHFAEESRRLAHPGLIAAPAPIQRWILSGNGRARAAQARAREAGFDARAILSPTVPKEEERIRISLHAYNTREQISALLEAIARE